MEKKDNNHKLRRKKNGLTIVLFDWLNVMLDEYVVIERKRIDWKKLQGELTKYGKVVLPFIFIPDNYTLPFEIHDQTFYPILCPRKGHDGKEKDDVDTIMAELLSRLLPYSTINTVIFIAGDGDYVRSLNTVNLNGLRTYVIGVEKTSKLLKRDADEFSLIPFK